MTNGLLPDKNHLDSSYGFLTSPTGHLTNYFLVAGTWTNVNPVWANDVEMMESMSFMSYLNKDVLQEVTTYIICNEGSLLSNPNF